MSYQVTRQNSAGQTLSSQTFNDVADAPQQPQKAAPASGGTTYNPTTGAPQHYAATTNSIPTYGENSQSVLDYQKQLNQQNANVPGYKPIAEDGKYGPQTQAAANFKSSGDTTQSKVPQTDQQKVDDYYTDLAKRGQDFSDYITNVQNGTVPLNNVQKSQLDVVNKNYQKLIEQQQLENKGARGTANVRGYQTGSAEYDPNFQSKTIQTIVAAGLSRVGDLQNQQADAVNKLTQSFRDDDIKAAKDAFDVYKDTTKDIADHLQKTIDDAYTKMKDAQDYQLRLQSQAIENEKFALDLKTSGYKFDSNGKLVLDTNANNLGEAIPGETGIPLLDSNTKTTVSGVPYVDGTNLTGKDASNAQQQAAQLGIPYLGKDQADAQANIETARINMDNIQNSLQGILPTSASGRLFDLSGKGHTILGNSMKALFQTNDQISSFNAYRSAAIQALRAMAGSKGLRINQAEILQSVNQDIPKITDTIATAKAKLAKVNSMLSSQEKGLYGSKIYDTYNEGSANADLQTYYNSSPAHGAQVDAILKNNPDLTDSQVLQLTQP